MNKELGTVHGNANTTSQHGNTTHGNSAGENAPSIKRLSIKHEGIMEWLLVNPDKKMRECAQAFNVSTSWLSIIVHSSAFQERYKELLNENLDERVIPLRNKLTGVAHVAVEKLGEMVDLSTDPDFMLSVTDKMLNRLGYSSQKNALQAQAGPGGTVNVFTSVSAEALERARQRRQSMYEERAIEPEALPSPEEVPSGS